MITQADAPDGRIGSALAAPLVLPNGTVLANRVAKAAMTEQLAARDGSPSERLVALYRRWASGGAGLLITGNVMVQRDRLVEPYNVVLDDASPLDRFREWADTARASDAQVWLQLNHPGRQALRAVARRSVAPSPVRSKHWYLFAPPRQLDAVEIAGIIEAFGHAAGLAQQAGFTGVQLHAAHGFLVSQFLSPLTNRRADEWGGPLANRMRFLLECVRAIRRAVSDTACVSVKLNCADFQRGGFTFEEALAVVAALDDEGVDLIEITGGNYEVPRSLDDVSADQAGQNREAFFADHARQVKASSRTPVMLTGGIRAAATMEAAVRDGAADVVGLARAMAVVPDLADRLLTGQRFEVVRPRRTGVRLVDLYLESPWHAAQLRRLSRGDDPLLTAGALRTAASVVATRARWRLHRGPR